jgi:divalent metal cation (Fe/Co/Zn/Cd) transporter
MAWLSYQRSNSSWNDPGGSRTSDLRRGLRLEIFTVGWNVVEAVIAIVAGTVAGSVALVGFGLDSVIESVSGVALYTRLHGELHGDDSRNEQRERRALLFVGVSFLLIAAYVLYESIETLWNREAPKHSSVGVVLAAVSLVVMPFLGWRKHLTARALGSRALESDAKETFVCAYLSLALLLGLLLNSALGWWWADPIAGLAMLPLILHEGKEAIEESRIDYLSR